MASVDLFLRFTTPAKPAIYVLWLIWKNWLARNGPNGIGSRPLSAGWKARSSGRLTSRSEAPLIPNPIRKVLSTIRKHRVRALLMGGQACVFHGAAELSRDTDFAIVADPANLRRLQKVLDELQAEVIAVPPFELKYLRQGHAIHFRCYHPEAFRVRIDVMSKMRGVAPFATLWRRRVSVRLPDGETYDLLSVPDLVHAKKTQRDKDWPMVRRLLEADITAKRDTPAQKDLRFWLLELRTPALLVEFAQLYPKLCVRLRGKRALLEAAFSGDIDTLQKALQAEEIAERERDRRYWLPLKRQIEDLRHRQTRIKWAKKPAAGESSNELPKYHDLFIAAIRGRQVLRFSYEGRMRVVEPQTYGMSYTGRYVLRGYQTGGESRSGQSNIAKLFDVAKVSKLERSGQHFKQALPSHNPQDSAMKVVFATLRPTSN